MSVCPICVNARKLDEGTLAANATIAGSTAMFDWLGKDDATISVTDAAKPEADQRFCARQPAIGSAHPG